MNGTRIVRTIVPPDAEDMRLDVFLSSRFSYRSRAEWQKSVKNGEILLNGSRVRASRQLRTGEEISYDASSLTEPPVREDYSVLAEYPEFLVIAKPGDLPVHPAGPYFEHTLFRMLLKRYAELYPVNRLDRETSGICLFARNVNAANRLGRLITEHKFRKEYLVFVEGRFPAERIAEGFLSPDRRSIVRKKRRFTEEELPDSENCRTDFIRLAEKDGISLVKCLLHTGRLHQIRATLLALGYPVVGDKLYGVDEGCYLRQSGEGLTEEDRLRLRVNRQALHAWHLGFRSPFTGEELFFETPLPEDLKSLPCSNVPELTGKLP